MNARGTPWEGNGKSKQGERTRGIHDGNARGETHEGNAFDLFHPKISPLRLDGRCWSVKQASAKSSSAS
eukprot:5044434-Pleurochrysis_carterae.AAC.1